MDLIWSKLTHAFSKNFFIDLSEEIMVAANKASTIANRDFGETERKVILPQLRHSCFQEALAQVCQSNDFPYVSTETNPKGGIFGFTSSDGVHILRSNVQKHRGVPKPTKFRRDFSGLNEHLNPVQTDLFDIKEKANSERLCALLIISFDNRISKSLPAYIGIGLPNSELSAWLGQKSLSEIISMYHDTVSEIKVFAETIIVDKAIPKLKN